MNLLSQEMMINFTSMDYGKVYERMTQNISETTTISERGV